MIRITTIVLIGIPAGAIECVDWSGTILPPTVIEGIDTGQVISVGEHLVIAGQQLRVYHACNPIAPVLIGAVDLPEAPSRLRVIDGVVYAVCGSSGLLAADLAEPTAPTVRTVFAPGGTVVDVAMVEDAAVVVTADSMLYTLTGDLPVAPVVASELATGQSLQCVAAAGHVALVGAYEGLLPVDVTDPAAPMVGELCRPACSTWWYPILPFNDLIVEGTTAYAAVHYYWPYVEPGTSAYSKRRVVTLDITDAMNPVAVNWMLANDGRLVSIGDRLAVVGQKRLDILAKDSLELEARFALHDEPIALTAQSEADLYITDAERFYHIDVSSTSCVQPHAITSHVGDAGIGAPYRNISTCTRYYDHYGDTYLLHRWWIYDMAGGPDLILDGSSDVYGPGWVDLMCYFGATDHYLLRSYYRLSDPTSRWLNLYSLEGGSSTTMDGSILAVRGDRLWVGDRLGPEVIVYDIGGSSDPVELGRIDAPDSDLTDKAKRDGDLVISISPEQLWAFDISNDVPTSLSLIPFESPERYHQIQIDGHMLEMATSEGFRIWNYTTPTEPAFLGELSCPFNPTMFAADGDLLVVADNEHFKVFRTSPGLLPRPLSRVIDFPCHSLTLSDHRLFISFAEGNVMMYDLSVPSAPSVVGVAHGPTSQHPFVDGDRLYAGCAVFPLPCEMTAIDQPDEPESPEIPPALAVTLHDPSPNPFNPRTTVAFDLVRAGRATVAVYDLGGRRLTTLADGMFEAGRHEVVWTGMDDLGQAAPSGTYLVRLVGESAVRTVKGVLVR